MAPDLYFILNERLYHVTPIALHIYYKNWEMREYEIQNWNDGDTWRISIHSCTIFHSIADIVEKIQIYYKLKKYDYVADLMTGTFVKEDSKGLTYNSLPSSMAKWPYPETYKDYPILLTILRDKKVINAIKSKNNPYPV